MPHAEHHSGDRTILVGLIGRGISLSRTPAMHVAEARAQGMVCTYNLLDMDDAAMADQLCRQTACACGSARPMSSTAMRVIRRAR